MGIQSLLSPKSIAIVGASEKIGPGFNAAKALEFIGYEGDIHLVNPRAQELFGRRTYRSEEHTSELQSLTNIVCRLLLEKKNASSCPTLQILTPSANSSSDLRPTPNSRLKNPAGNLFWIQLSKKSPSRIQTTPHMAAPRPKPSKTAASTKK